MTQVTQVLENEEKILNKVNVALFFHSYDPSEPGAGKNREEMEIEIK